MKSPRCTTMLQIMRCLPALAAPLMLAVATVPRAQEQPPKKIAGVVSDLWGRPVEGAKVEATALNGDKPITQSAHSDQGGRFGIMTLAAGPHQLAVTATGFEAALLKPIPAGDTEVQATLRRIPGIIQGTLLDPAGKPVADAWVQTLPDHDLRGTFGRLPSPITHKTVKTDEQGRFRLDPVSPGTYRVKITHPGFAQISRRDQVVHSGKATGLGEVSLERGTAVSGEVQVNGGPAARVKVVITSKVDSTTWREAVSIEAITDEKGRFAMPNRLPSGSYEAMAARTTLPNPLLQIADYNKTKTAIVLKPGQEEFSLPIALEK